jgi:hypothetical protein
MMLHFYTILDNALRTKLLSLSGEVTLAARHTCTLIPHARIMRHLTPEI